VIQHLGEVGLPVLIPVRIVLKLFATHERASKAVATIQAGVGHSGILAVQIFLPVEQPVVVWVFGGVSAVARVKTMGHFPDIAHAIVVPVIHRIEAAVDRVAVIELLQVCRPITIEISRVIGLVKGVQTVEELDAVGDAATVGVA
jgi:hypothetical protein